MKALEIAARDLSEADKKALANFLTSKAPELKQKGKNNNFVILRLSNN